jgi:hypothetical protein
LSISFESHMFFCKQILDTILLLNDMKHEMTSLSIILLMLGIELNFFQNFYINNRY